MEGVKYEVLGVQCNSRQGVEGKNASSDINICKM